MDLLRWFWSLVEEELNVSLHLCLRWGVAYPRMSGGVLCTALGAVRIEIIVELIIIL